MSSATVARCFVRCRRLAFFVRKNSRTDASLASTAAMVAATESIGLARASSAGASTRRRRQCLKKPRRSGERRGANQHHSRRLFLALAGTAIASIALAGLAFATGALFAGAFAAITARGFHRRGE